MATNAPKPNVPKPKRMRADGSSRVAAVQHIAAPYRFHRLGVIAATIVMMIGIAAVAAGVERLELWKELPHDTLALVLSFTLIGVAAVCLVVYFLIRAIGWAIGGFAA